MTYSPGAPLSAGTARQITISEYDTLLQWPGDCRGREIRQNVQRESAKTGKYSDCTLEAALSADAWSVNRAANASISAHAAAPNRFTPIPPVFFA